MDPTFALSFQHPRTSVRIELVIHWKAYGWDIHELDGTETKMEPDGFELMDLLLKYKLNAPDFRLPFARMWSELDLMVEAAPSPSQLPEAGLREFQNGFAELGGWIEATTAAAPKGVYFQSP